MSRGFYIKLALKDEIKYRRVYVVYASGWGSSEESEVGEVSIDIMARTIDFKALGEWQSESFYIPAYSEIETPVKVESTWSKVNKNYGWWNMRLLSSLHRIITMPEYREEVWFYQ